MRKSNFQGKRHSAETRKKMSLIRKGKTLEELYGKEKALRWKAAISRERKGKTLVELFGQEKANKIKLAISHGNKGKTRTPEAIQKMVANHHWTDEERHMRSERLKVHPLNYWLGKKRYPETIEKMRRNHKTVRYWLGKKQHPESVQKMREKLTGRKNPEHSAYLEQFYKEHPEKHANYVMAHQKNGKSYISKNQRELHQFVCGIFPEAMLEYPIETQFGIRFADVGIPSLRIDLEYDGSFWHKDSLKDTIRDSELNQIGWKVVRIKEGDKQWKEKVNLLIQTQMLDVS